MPGQGQGRGSTRVTSRVSARVLRVPELTHEFPRKRHGGGLGGGRGPARRVVVEERHLGVPQFRTADFQHRRVIDAKLGEVVLGHLADLDLQIVVLGPAAAVPQDVHPLGGQFDERGRAPDLRDRPIRAWPDAEFGHDRVGGAPVCVFAGPLCRRGLAAGLGRDTARAAPGS